MSRSKPFQSHLFSKPCYSPFHVKPPSRVTCHGSTRGMHRFLFALWRHIQRFRPIAVVSSTDSRVNALPLVFGRRLLANKGAAPPANRNHGVRRIEGNGGGHVR
eukprot:6159277-Prymnesium_polylepis.1